MKHYTFIGFFVFFVGYILQENGDCNIPLNKYCYDKVPCPDDPEDAFKTRCCDGTNNTKYCCTEEEFDIIGISDVQVWIKDNVALFVSAIFAVTIFGFVIPMLFCCKFVPGCWMHGNKDKERVRRAEQENREYMMRIHQGLE